MDNHTTIIFQNLSILALECCFKNIPGTYMDVFNPLFEETSPLFTAFSKQCFSNCSSTSLALQTWFPNAVWVLSENTLHRMWRKILRYVFYCLLNGQWKRIVWKLNIRKYLSPCIPVWMGEIFRVKWDIGVDSCLNNISWCIFRGFIFINNALIKFPLCLILSL